MNRTISINFDWLYQFFKSGKLRVFTITINGIGIELEDKDFGFIRRLSNTCKLNRGDEQRILDRNKAKIAYKVMKGSGLTTEDTICWYDEYEKNTESLEFIKWLRRRGGKKKELGDILSALASLPAINDMLKCHKSNLYTANKSHMWYVIESANILGIIKDNGDHGNSNHAKVSCSDDYNILQDFPGYFENQELWDYWKMHYITRNIFLKVVKGEYPNYLRDCSYQKNIEDAWS